MSTWGPLYKKAFTPITQICISNMTEWMLTLFCGTPGSISCVADNIVIQAQIGCKGLLLVLVQRYDLMNRHL